MEKFNKLEKYARYSILIILIFSIIVLSLTSMHHVSGDGCWYIPVGKFIANNQKIPLFEPLGRDEPFWSPPLYHVFVAAVYYIFSYVDIEAANFAVKFVSPIFGILSLIFSFLVIKKLFSLKIAFYSTVFLAFVPIFIDYSILSYAESTLTFFVILSIYFLIDDKIVLSGIAAGLSILAKYNGFFIVPILLYFLYKKNSDKNLFYKNAFIILSLSFLIASPWLIRNWLLLGNPIWPFLNFIFDGVVCEHASKLACNFQSKSYADINFANLVHPNMFIFTYLGIFGVPDGNYNAFLFFDIPYLGFLSAIWLIGTFIFITPLVIGFFNISNINRKIKWKSGIFILWVFSYVLLFFIYVINVGFSVSRMMLPAFPAFAVFWAFGYEKITNKVKLKKIASLLTVLIIIGFVFTAVIKIWLAANAWDQYQKDFEWVKSNTNKNAVFIAEGQCVPYNAERTSLYVNDENFNKADYIWVNQNFKLDRRSILDKNRLKSVQSKGYKIVYSNINTGTIVYAVDK